MTASRIPNAVHRERPWRIHEIAAEFHLEDVWALPTPGATAEDFSLFVEEFVTASTAQSPSRAARVLWKLRWTLGELLGWDDPETGVGSRVPSIAERLPADLRDRPGPVFEELPFTSLYLTDDEWAAEVANRTVHGIMHIGWAPDGDGGRRGEMAVYVKPNGLFGSAYMASIKPFRHLLVYPPMMRQIERRWRARKAEQAATGL